MTTSYDDVFGPGSQGDGKRFPAQRHVIKGQGQYRGKRKEIIIARRSDMAQALITHRRKPLRMGKHKFFLPVYDINAQKILLKCARQVAKSTTLCNLMLIEPLKFP